MRKILSLTTVCLLCFFSVYAQQHITGKVLDANGQPVPNSTIVIKGTKKGTFADASGNFSVAAKQGDVLTISAINYKAVEIKVADQKSLTVSLATSENTMDEVIVTAGGIKSKKREIGTSNTIVKGDVLNAGKSTTIAGGLQGKVAGLLVSNTSGGVNPNFRLVLRGQRSLTGNNQALVVLDNVIVPTSVLGNLNPQDVEDVNVLNGAGAAALYGSQASNGAIIITTKKGHNGATNVRVAHTLTWEQVAFYPKLQTKFGGGGSSYGYDVNGNPEYSELENEAYGPAYDGTMRPLGAPLEDGSQDSALYVNTNQRKKFWNLGLTNQTDFSLTSGDDVSTFYLSGQYNSSTGTTPGDKYNRAVLRLNGTRKIGDKITVTYASSYTQNRYNITTQTASMYTNLLDIPSSIPITTFKNWRTDKFANPNGYYNPWYLNPYFSADNYRSVQRNDYLTANLEVKFTPVKGLDLTARQGIATRNYSNKNTVGAFDYTKYAEDISGAKSDIAATVVDGSAYTTELLSDLFAHYDIKVSDFDFNLIAGGQWRQDQSKAVGVGANGLVIPGLYNVSTGVGTPAASEANFEARQMGFYGDLRIGYKNFLFLHGTGRNDWVSILDPNNRSFFYPSVDLSFVASDAIDALKNSRVINYLKIRGGWSKVGQVNLGNDGDFGAYYLLPTFSQANGYPYGNQAGYTVGNVLVDNNLRPELTKGYEIGADVNLLKDKIVSNLTFYSSKTNNQTVSTRIANSTGFTNLLVNTGQTSSSGFEAALHVTPIRTKQLEVTVGGNYTYLDNKVDFISAALPKLSLAAYGDGAGSYAVPGQPFPVIMGFDYQRDPAGHVIVDKATGAPLKNSSITILGSGVPKNRVGLDASVRYNNFQFSVLFEYRGGYKVYNSGGGEFDWAGVGIRSASFNRDRFVFPNSVYEDPDKPGTYIKNTNITVQDGNGNSGFWTDNDMNRDITSNYVTSGDFWKLRELSISYDLPTKLLSKSKFIKSATISVQGRNLFVWLSKDNYYTDPEYSDAGNTSNGIGLTGLSETPPSRFFGATLSVTF